jgi:hypothetical protein
MTSKIWADFADGHNINILQLKINDRCCDGIITNKILQKISTIEEIQHA